MAGDGDCIRSRDSTETDSTEMVPPPEKKPKIESDPEAKIETDPEAKTEAPQDYFMHKGRKIFVSERDDPEYNKQLELFAKQLKESEGFDVDWDSSDYKFSVVNFDWQRQIEEDRSNEVLMEQLMHAAIEELDEEYGTKLESAKYVSANIVVCKGLSYYITFWAVDVLSSDQEPKLYQANVWKYREEFTVLIAKPRPSQNLS